jgi:cyclophilin family peptidyl-prolyl cis-trans isomerase
MSKKRHIIEKEKHARKLALQAKKKKNIRTGITIGVVILVIAALTGLALSNWPPSKQSANQAAAKQYPAPPPMIIDTNIQYFATVKMAKGGQFVIRLFADKAPQTVNNFVFLAREGFYNGTTFHRVIDGFMAQGGDPTGSGAGGPGYQFADEANDLVFDRAGLVAMANAGPDTNGSQFFITYAPTPWLNGKHTIFGEVVEGMEVVNGLTRRDPDSNPTFTGDVIESITITEVPVKEQ